MGKKKRKIPPQRQMGKMEKLWKTYGLKTIVYTIISSLLGVGTTIRVLVPSNGSVAQNAERDINHNSTVFNNTGDVNYYAPINLIENGSLNQLDEIETGKPINDVSSDTYFYVSAVDLGMLPDDPSQILARGPGEYRYIIQKTTEGSYVLGYVSRSTLATFEQGHTDEVMLFSEPYEEFNYPISIPFTAIDDVSYRFADLRTGGQYVLDVATSNFSTADQQNF